jgi:hypothetical protein
MTLDVAAARAWLQEHGEPVEIADEDALDRAAAVVVHQGEPARSDLEGAA